MLTLLCPGLLGPVPSVSEGLPKVPTIDRLLGRADRAATGFADAATALLCRFGIATGPERDLPTAPLCLLGEPNGECPDGYWLHADPVHLRPDRDRLLLFAGADMAPSRAEADALVTLFNGHFGLDGLRLAAPEPDRWYLHSYRVLDLRTEPLDRVIGGPVPADVPSGADARRWRGLMNEIQMLFFGSEVNRLREHARRPTIGGVWTWGGGILPDSAQNQLDLPDVVIGDDPLTSGLARWSGVEQRSLGEWSHAAFMPGRGVLVLWNRLQAALLERDLSKWSAALVELDARLADIKAEIGRGRLPEILIDPCRGLTYRVSKSALRRFWRRGGLADALRAADAMVDP
jgi:hypothetical protein